MRDEAHRFSRRLHHKNENKKMSASWLDNVKGVGEKTKKKILLNLKVEKAQLSKMAPESISNELGISVSLAKNIYDYLKAEKS